MDYSQNFYDTMSVLVDGKHISAWDYYKDITIDYSKLGIWHTSGEAPDWIKQNTKNQWDNAIVRGGFTPNPYIDFGGYISGLNREVVDICPGTGFCIVYTKDKNK